MTRVGLSITNCCLCCLVVCVARAQEDWGPSLFGPGENGIIFSEFHYHPPGDAGEEEFVELTNRGVRWVDIGGWRLSGGIEFEIPYDTVLAPGSHLAVARRAAALRARGGVGPVVGDYQGRLSNSGEIVVLENRVGRRIATLHYRDGRGPRGGLWPRRADGRGWSLELIAPHSEWEHSWRWAASRAIGGTPGRASSFDETIDVGAEERRKQPGKKSESRSPRPTIVRINEVVFGPGASFVEIVAFGVGTARLDGLFLSTGHPSAGAVDVGTRVKLSGSLAAGRVALVTAAGVDELLASLQADKADKADKAEDSSARDAPKKSRLYLHGSRRELHDAIEIPRLASGVSLGRVPDGGRNLLRLPTPTPGRRNEPQPSSTVVINEIFYNGADDDGSDEFIELHNPSRKREVSLSGWLLDDAVRFKFPATASIPAGGFVVVAKDPPALRRSSGTLAADALLLGPFRGKLSNKTERVVLRDTWGTVVDEVRYADRPPWPQQADGDGSSLELRHPDIDNRWGESWARGGPGGSPGSANRSHRKLIPPMVVGVRHEPVAPAPGDMVTVYAHVISSRKISDVRVAYKEIHLDSRPILKRMSDKGDLGDGAARDGKFAARFKLPSRLPNGAVLDYRFVIKPSGGRVVTIPDTTRGFLMPVEPPQKRTDGMPNYHVLMIPRDAERFAKQSRAGEDWYPCTFVASGSGAGIAEGRGEVRHNCFVRLRGNNSRRPADGRMSYRLRLAGGEYFDGRDRLILNAFSSFRQKAGGDFMKHAGLPTPQVTTVRLSIPGQDDNRYLDVEVVDENFLLHRFGADDGELFRGRRGKPFGADFSFHGRTDLDQYLAVYQRVNKKESRELGNLFDLLEALDLKDDAAYWQSISKLIDVPEWATYFAANNLLGNTEGGLSVSDADDFFVARRATDGKWVLIPWDHDSTYGDPRQKLFRPTLAAIRRFVRHPRVAMLYQRRVRELIEGPLSGPSVVLEILDMGRTFRPGNLARLARFSSRRQTFVREGYVFWPNAAVGLPAEVSSADSDDSADFDAPSRPAPIGGFGSRLFVPAGSSKAHLRGLVDPAFTVGVEVGGSRVDYDPVRGEWKGRVDLNPGANSLWIVCNDQDGRITWRGCVNVESSRSPRRVPATISGRVVWSATGGPYYLSGTVTVSGAASLRITAGTEVICGPDAVLSVRGRLEVDGERTNPVAFRTETRRRPWKGIRFDQPGIVSRPKEHRIAYCRFDGGAGEPTWNRVKSSEPKEGEKPPEPPDDAPRPFLRVRGPKLILEGCVFRGISGHAVGVEKGSVVMKDCVVSDSRHGLVTVDGLASVSGCRFERLSGDGLDLRQSRRKPSTLGQSVFRDVQGTAVRAEGSTVSLDDVIISSAATGVEARDASQVNGKALTIVECGVAVLVDTAPWGEVTEEKKGLPRRSTLRIRGSTLQPNGRAVLASPQSRVSLEDCYTGGDRALSGSVKSKSERSTSQVFRAPQRGDFRVAETGRVSEPR